MRAWDELATAFGPDYRVIAPELRGRGDCDKPDSPYGLNALVTDAQGILGCPRDPTHDCARLVARHGY
jgi:hypothetical protein